MQSLSRQIRRGNAHIVFNNVTKSMETVQKRGTTKTKWNFAKKNAMQATEDNYRETVSKPIIRDCSKQVIKSKSEPCQNHANH